MATCAGEFPRHDTYCEASFRMNLFHDAEGDAVTLSDITNNASIDHLVEGTIAIPHNQAVLKDVHARVHVHVLAMAPFWRAKQNKYRTDILAAIVNVVFFEAAAAAVEEAAIAGGGTSGMAGKCSRSSIE